MSTTALAVNPWMMLPFGILLALIALAPLLFPVWWARHYPKVSCGLAAITLIYYLAGLRAGSQVWHTTHEYVSFIILIGSLFVVAGGIHIHVKSAATPFANVVFLGSGAVIANILGTTGAAMLLLRPWLRMNRQRISAYHVVFFIFIVANVGGCLTPIGDPPLFLGYLMGVPFWWVLEHCLPIWGVGVGILLLMFFAVDYWNLRRAPKDLPAESGPPDHWRFEGLNNLWFLAIILAAVFVKGPPFLREAMMAAAALASHFTTAKSVHKSNHFNLHPIREVAVLFIGIFATMMPALDWLQANATGLEHLTPSLLYWGTGTLSSGLDNAPTYLCFLKAIAAHFTNPEIISQTHQLIQNHGDGLASLAGAHAQQIRETFLALQKYHPTQLAAGEITTDQIEVAYLLGNLKLNSYLVAISIGAVFFGANTYIANGPNFMVKSIADQQKIPTPTFLGYIGRFTLPFMVPMLLAVWWLFF
jgi:Na+/H+ antiporter NhaD/arsenite permease-like protein